MKCAPRVVDLTDWHRTWQQVHLSGEVTFGFLTGVDRGDTVDVVGHCFGPTGSTWIATTVDLGAQELPSIADLFPGAASFERELLQRFAPGALLRKDVPLPARMNTPWPGTTKRPPGVLDTWAGSS
jgi:hypothetical protein